MADVALYCLQKQLPYFVTRTWDDPIPGVSTSNSHNGRAFDMSVHGWTEDAIAKFMEEFENKYKAVAATSASDGKKRLIVLHDAGLGRHFHFQVSEQSLYNRLSMIFKAQ